MFYSLNWPAVRCIPVVIYILLTPGNNISQRSLLEKFQGWILKWESITKDLAIDSKDMLLLWLLLTVLYFQHGILQQSLYVIFTITCPISESVLGNSQSSYSFISLWTPGVNKLWMIICLSWFVNHHHFSHVRLNFLFWNNFKLLYNFQN